MSADMLRRLLSVLGDRAPVWWALDRLAAAERTWWNATATSS
jgi:hypothetical protein